MGLFARLSCGVQAFIFVLACSLSASVQAEGRDEIVFFFNDALGSVVAAVNEAGELCWAENYTPFGDKTVNDDAFSPPGTGCGIVGEERDFTGHTEDVDSDLVYMQQRYYDPSIGRFLSIDPRDADSLDPRSYNRYAYAANNPYKYIDPDGRWIEDIFIGVPSLAMGVVSLVRNTASGNWAGAAVDAVGIVADVEAL